MKLEIKNAIKIDDQIEKIKEIHDCQVMEKGNAIYFIYQNEMDEKVIIKCQSNSVSINRFSNPHTLMTFEKGVNHIFDIPTPMGIQQLVTSTHSYQFDEENKVLNLSYDLLQPESLAQFATYRLEMKWY